MYFLLITPNSGFHEKGKFLMIQMGYLKGSTNGSKHTCEAGPYKVRGNVILFCKQLRTQQGEGRTVR